MRLLLVNQYYWPDVAATAQMLTDLAERLVCRGHQVTVICSRRSWRGEGRPLPKRDLRNGVRIVRVQAVGGAKGATGTRRVLELLSFFLLTAFWSLWITRPDVVVTFTTPPMIGLVGRLLQVLKGARHVHWCMDMFPDLLVASKHIRESGILHRALAVAARSYLSSSDAVLVLGQRMRSRILRYQPPLERLHIVPVWADGARVVPVPRDSNWFIHKHGLEGKFVVQYSGNIGAVESLDTLVAAAEQLASDQTILFLFIGEGADHQRLRGAVRQKGLPNFRFEPYQRREDLAYSLSSAHVHIVYLMPGKGGLRVPSKIYGIMAAGGAVLYLGDRASEVADIVEANAIGFVLQDGDVGRLVSAVGLLCQDPDRLADMSRRSRAAFEREYDVATVVERFDRLLRQL